jgi:serine/threonine-protein kinase SRPK3
VLREVLHQHRLLLPLQARALTDFLLPMLEYVPSRRATAAEMLAHPWLRGVARQQEAAAAAGQQDADVAPEDGVQRDSRCVLNGTQIREVQPRDATHTA